MKSKKQTRSSVSAKDVFGNEVITVPVIIPQPMRPGQRLPKFPSALTPLPEVPIPRHKQDQPPLRSAFGVTVANANRKYNVEVVDIGFMNPQTPGWKAQPTLPAYTLVYRNYWMRTSMQRVPGPQSFEYSVTTTEGISQTDTLAISAQLGIEVKFLSLTLGLTFSHEITVSEEHSITNTYRIDIPEGKFGVWILWQLVQEFLAIDSRGRPVQWSGKMVMPGTPLPLNARLPATQVTDGCPTYTPQLTIFDN